MGRGKGVRPKNLPAKLRAIREKLGLSQAELAKKLKKVDSTVYPGLISRYEHGKIEPSLLVVLEYARIADVSMETLVDDKKKL